jgi:hypothetical protein
MFAHDYYALATTTTDTPSREIAPSGTRSLAEPAGYMDFDKLTATTSVLQARYPEASMAAIFHHALEVAMYLSAGSHESKATAWPFLDIMCQAFAGQSAKIATLENAVDIAKAAEATKAAKLKVAESATKIAHKKIQELDIKVTKAEAAKASTMEASREHLIGLVVSESVLKHFFEREVKMLTLLNFESCTEAASKVLVALLRTNVDTVTRLCGNSESDMEILQQRANKLVEPAGHLKTMDLTRLIEDVSKALPSTSGPAPAATGSVNATPTLTATTNTATSSVATGKVVSSPFKRHTSSHPNQSSGLGSPIFARNAPATSTFSEATKLTAKCPEMITLSRLFQRAYAKQFNSSEINMPLWRAMAGGEYAITMYDLYMKMLEDCHGGVDERVKMDTIAAIIKDFHLKALTVDNDLVGSLLAYYSRAEISDFVGKWTKLRLNGYRG